MFRTSARSLRILGELWAAEAAGTPAVSATAARRRREMRSCRTMSHNIVKSKSADVPIETLPYADFIWKNIDQFGDRTAMVCGMTGRNYTYEIMQHLARKFGSALMNRGLRKGEVVGLICPNIPEFAITFLGVVCVAGVVTTINPTYTADEIARQLQDAGAKFVVTVPPLADKVKEALAFCPMVEEAFMIGEATDGFTPMTALAGESGETWKDAPHIRPEEDVFVLPYSSGTTGPPKGVMLTHRNVTTNITQMTHADLVKPNNSDDTLLAILPFFHSYSMSTIMSVGLHYGCKIVTLPRFDPDMFLQAIHEHKPTVMHLVPPLLNFLAMYTAVNKDDFCNLHTIFCGAAPLSKSLATAFLKQIHPYKVDFQEGYGMTELSPVSHVSPFNCNRIGTCGVLVPNTEAKVVSLETGESLGTETAGELCIRGPQVMKGYLNNPRATRETIDSEGWLHTGDIAVYDNDGYFQVIDRMKELIKVKGLQVAPSELEDLLLSHPQVEDAAVIGVPDAMAGELPKAYIVAHDKNLTDDSIHKFLEGKVAPHKYLKGGIEFVKSIPKSQTGKILRRELKGQVMGQA